ncbi:hypothetical protein EDD16DRAFT_1653948 [Pisolithus croceorrhizus]|nr:hypothetical protein EDD16DRAFT_1653948 [Pisolithus croceorrhizus]
MYILIGVWYLVTWTSANVPYGVVSRREIYPIQSTTSWLIYVTRHASIGVGQKTSEGARRSRGINIDISFRYVCSLPTLAVNR